MPQSKSPNAYPSIRELMNRALQAKTGIRIKFSTPGTARSKQMQCYTVRKRELEGNLAKYELDDPRRSSTIYDLLTFYRTDEQGRRVDSKDTKLGRVLVISQDQGIDDDTVEEF